MILHLIIRRTAILLGGPKCGTEVRTTAAALTEREGAYLITKERDRQGRRVFRWEIGRGEGAK